MNRMALVVAVLMCIVILVAGSALAQSKSPLILAVSKVTVGTRHIVTLRAEAIGKWSDTGKDAGITSSDIRCYQRLSFCIGADAVWSSAGTEEYIENFDILRWDSNELVAVDNSQGCVIKTIRFDFHQQIVTASSALTGEKNCQWAKAKTTFLLDGIK